jgi:hypothetical protein
MCCFFDGLPRVLVTYKRSADAQPRAGCNPRFPEAVKPAGCPAGLVACPGTGREVMQDPRMQPPPPRRPELASRPSTGIVKADFG